MDNMDLLQQKTICTKLNFYLLKIGLKLIWAVRIKSHDNKESRRLLTLFLSHSYQFFNKNNYLFIPYP